MSIERITICTCDRCGNRMSPDDRTDEHDLDVGGALGRTIGGPFADLCDGCMKSVRNLLARVFLRKADPAPEGGEE